MIILLHISFDCLVLWNFVENKIIGQGSLYNDYNLTEPPLNLDVNDMVAQRTEKLINHMYQKIHTLLKRHEATLIKTVRVRHLTLTFRSRV